MSGGKKIDLFTRLGEIPTRWLYLIVIIIVAIPILKPLQMPFSITQPTRAVYETIEGLPAGAVVVIGGDNAYGFHVEIKECLQAVLRHLFSKNVKIVFVAFRGDTQMFHEIARAAVGISKDKPFMGKVYGIDWVDLGFIPGGESAIAAFAANPRIVKVDAYGNNVENLPIMKDIGKADTWALYIEDSGNGVAAAIRQIVVPYKTKMVVLNTAGWYPTHMPYVKAGLIKGQTMGIKGAAEYEKLMGFVGLGHSGADVISTTHLLMVILVLLGNISYFGRYLMQNRQRKVKGG
jgi:hypothetical protein